MKRTVRTRGGRYAVSSALAKAIKPPVRGSEIGEHDPEVSRLKRLSSLVRWVSSSQTSMRQRNTRRSPASAIAGQTARPAGSEKWLTNAIESITDGFALWDADDRLILCNSRFREFYPSVAPSLNSGVDYERVLRAAMDKGQYRVDGPAEDWLQRRLRAHRVHGGTCEEHLSDGRWLQATEHRTSDGGRVCIRTDITQRKQAEHAMRQSRATLQAMIDAVDEMIAMVNADGVILAINRSGAEDFGRQPRDLVGRSLPDQFDCRLATQLKDIISAVLAGMQRIHADIRWRDRSLHLSAQPVLDELGAPAAVSIFSRDITERVHTEEAAREHRHQLMRYMRIATMGEMTAALAHELNQPIAAIVNYCNGSLRRLASGRWNKDDLRDAITETYGEAKRARDIIQNVVRFVRKAPRQRATAKIGSLVESVGNLVRKDLERHGIEMVVDLVDPGVAVNVNVVEIEQTLLNLLRNSMESIAETLPAVRRITLRATVAAGVIEMSVHDTGKGFTTETAEHAFDPFFTTKAEGMGMGLAVCRTIVEDHGGRIWAEPADAASSGAASSEPAGIHLTLRIIEANNAAA